MQKQNHEGTESQNVWSSVVKFELRYLLMVKYRVYLA